MGSDLPFKFNWRCRYYVGANTGAIDASRASHVEVTNLTNGKAANIVFAAVEKAGPSIHTRTFSLNSRLD